DYAKPKGLSGDPVALNASLARADTLGMPRLSAGVIRTNELDVFGRANSYTILGRAFEGMARLTEPFQQTVVQNAETPIGRLGGAVLEHRLFYLRWPVAGERFEIRSGRYDVDRRSQALQHWMLDPATGQPWGVIAAREVCFDLDARKIIAISER